MNTLKSIIRVKLPQCPINICLEVDPRGILISAVPQLDTRKIRIYRQVANQFVKIIDIPIVGLLKKEQFLDKQAGSGKIRYKIIAVNKDGESKPKFLETIIYKPLKSR